MSAPDMRAALRNHAATLAMVSEAIENATDLLEAGGSAASVVSTLSLSAVNCTSVALALARRCGQLEVSNDNGA